MKDIDNFNLLTELFLLFLKEVIMDSLRSVQLNSSCTRVTSSSSLTGESSESRRSNKQKRSSVLTHHHNHKTTLTTLLTSLNVNLGSRVVRGRDWKWSTQDDARSEGTVVGVDRNDGWVEVIWDSGMFNYYRMGYEDKYDLALATSNDSVKLSTYHAIALQSLAMAKASSSNTQYQELNNKALTMKEAQKTKALATGAASLDNSLSSLVSMAKKSTNANAKMMMKLMPAVEDLSKFVDDENDKEMTPSASSSSKTESSASKFNKLSINNQKSSSTPVLNNKHSLNVDENNYQIQQVFFYFLFLSRFSY